MRERAKSLCLDFLFFLCVRRIKRQIAPRLKLTLIDLLAQVIKIKKNSLLFRLLFTSKLIHLLVKRFPAPAVCLFFEKPPRGIKPEVGILMGSTQSDQNINFVLIHFIISDPKSHGRLTLLAGADIAPQIYLN